MTDLMHVVPVDDLREHESSRHCWCRPVEHEEQPGLWIHNALDQRERYETQELKPQ